MSKELTFREVIANIKEGEVWENEYAPISFIRLRTGGVLDFNENDGINLSVKYSLRRKEYTFEEAFKASEEGKEIESSYSATKFYRDEYLTNNVYADWKFGVAFKCDEIRNKWYIND